MASVFVVVGVAPNAAGRVGTTGADEDEDAAGVDVAAAGAGAGVDAGKAEGVAASAPLRSHGLGGETIVKRGYVRSWWGRKVRGLGLCPTRTHEASGRTIERDSRGPASRRQVPSDLRLAGDAHTSFVGHQCTSDAVTTC